MPRNLTTGQYTPPSGTYGSTGQVISSTAYDAFVSDIGTEVGYSLDLRGEAVMTGSLNLGANKLINVANGVATTDGVNMQQLSSIVPSGTVITFAGSTIPAGYLWAQGQAVSRSTYAALFTAIGTTYGTGDGSTTFNLPNFNNRAGLGYDGTTFPLGTSGGSASASISVANLPAHSHAVYDPTHAHGVADPSHAHGVSQSPHAHSAGDSGHAHGGVPILGPPYGGGGGYGITNGYTSTGVGYANISIGGAYASISINGAYTGIGIYGAATGISLYNTGSNVALPVQNPYVYLYYLIKT